MRIRETSILPVVTRELRAQARQPLTYGLRLLAGLALGVGICLVYFRFYRTHGSYSTLTPQIASNAFGAALFGKLNLCLFIAIWVLVPLSTADAIARERREGTLPLLFLTPLRPWEVIMGKAFAHILRASTILLTMIPWLMVPILFGGVGFIDVALALLLDGTAVLAALTAGLLASALPRDWLKAVVIAELLALLLLLRMLSVHAQVLERTLRARPARSLPWGPSPIGFVLTFSRSPNGFIQHSLRMIAVTTDSSISIRPVWLSRRQATMKMETDWQTIQSRLSPSGQTLWLVEVAFMVARAALGLLVGLGIAALALGRYWQDIPPSAFQGELQRKFFTPRFFRKTLRRQLAHALSANPIGWLQVYSPAARLVKWGWCLFLLGAEILLSTSAEDLYVAQMGLGVILLLGLAFSAAGSFRSEVEAGAFELLLVTPLREIQIITGRLRGIWQQFLPALLIYAAGGLFLASGWREDRQFADAWNRIERITAGFCVLPVIGLYFSSLRTNSLVAWAATCVLGLGMWPLARLCGLSSLWQLLLQFGAALAAGILLWRRLRARRFVLQPRTAA